MQNVICKPHHAVVTVYGDIDEPMMLELAASLQQLHHGYDYKHFELEVSSPGGLVKALDYCVEVMERLRLQGVTFTTRALMFASSAAANLVSLGDCRETSRTAMFLYHKARIQDSPPVTAQSASEILTEVSWIDGYYLDLLVRRARRPGVAPPSLAVKDFSGSDWPIVNSLLIGAGIVQVPPDGRQQHSKRTQLRRLRKHVSACLAENNEKMLKQLYERLFELDERISAALALELRLVDRFVDTDSQHRSPMPAGGLWLPEWSPLLDPEDWLDRNSLCRHMLFLGETGSGKTLSGILPVVGSIMAPANRAVGCALIIDPKREIKPMMDKMQHSGINIYDIDIRQERQRPVLNLMAGEKLSVESALADDRFLEAARKILIRSASLSTVSPATVLAGQGKDASEYYWESEGSRLALTVLAFVLLILKYHHEIYGSNNADGLCQDADDSTRSKLLEFGEVAGTLFSNCDEGEAASDAAYHVLSDKGIRPAPNILALANSAMMSWFEIEQDQVTAEKIVDLVEMEIKGGDAGEIYRQIKLTWSHFLRTGGRTIHGVAGFTRACFADYTDATPAKTLYFGVEPYYRSVMKYGRQDIVPVDFTTAVNDEESRSVYVFQPDLNNSDALVAKALKAFWFETILNSSEREERGGTMPLAAYIADEFHRFITSDKVHGEQSFLDTCRSFGAFCVLACQSISSMEHALAEISGKNWAKNEAAISILLNNTANKLFFRSTDQKLKDYLAGLCPSAPGLGPVTSVRPPSTLQPGECYASLADGRFERCQLLPFGARQDAPGEAGPNLAGHPRAGQPRPGFSVTKAIQVAAP